jgi:hypothetical protein
LTTPTLVAVEDRQGEADLAAELVVARGVVVLTDRIGPKVRDAVGLRQPLGVAGAGDGVLRREHIGVPGHRPDRVALSVYATNATLDSTGVAAPYGFTVSGDGLGAAGVSVGSDGDAFGVANNTSMTVMDLLLATDAQAVNGVLYNGNATKRSHANDLFSAINQAGGF